MMYLTDLPAQYVELVDPTTLGELNLAESVSVSEGHGVQEGGFPLSFR